MKAPKLLKIVNRFLSADKEKQYEQTTRFKEILKKLKKKENSLKDKLKKEKDDKNRKQIKKDLAIICIQRKKGIEAIKKLKNEKKTE